MPQKIITKIVVYFLKEKVKKNPKNIAQMGVHGFS